MEVQLCVQLEDGGGLVETLELVDGDDDVADRLFAVVDF